MHRPPFHSTLRIATLTIASTLAAAPAMADQTIAQDGTAAHELLFISDEPGPIELPPGEGIFEGLFASHDPGWASPNADQPPDFYMLLPGHQVSLQRLSFDPGFSMYFPFTGTQILETDGSVYTFNALPDGRFDNDLIYAIDGVLGSMYSATFRVVDPSGIHSASDPFTLSFEAVPEPTVLALLGLASLAVRHRLARR